MNYNEILSALPYTKPFLFVDEIIRIDDEGVEGTFFLDENLDFYKGHFISYPVTPGAILTEIMAQIGVVCLGIFLLKDTLNLEHVIALTSTNIDFLKPVFPGEVVTVISTKKYFRFEKLKCDVKMLNRNREVVCIGTISGMIKEKQG